MSSSGHTRTGSIILTTTIVLSSISGITFAGDIHVPSQFSTIQTAINSASNGDTILVAPGTYNEALNFNGKAITLQSIGGADVTTIDATGFDTSVVTIPSANGAGQNVLNGFKLTGGKGTGTLSRAGGGLFITGGDTLLVGCKITNNAAFGSVAQPAGGSGGGISVSGRGSLTMRSCLVSENAASANCVNAMGGGISASGVNLTLIDCTFQANRAEGSGCTGNGGARGGALSIASSNAVLVNCVIFANICTGFGLAIAAGIDNSSNLTLVNCRITGNSTTGFMAGSRSSGIFNDATGTVTCRNCTIAGNTINNGPSSRAGGLYNNTTQPAVVYNSIVHNNSANQLGGGPGGAPTAQFSCIQGGYAGTGNIATDPMFINAGDFNLLDSSPCRDTGNLSLLPADSLDLDGDGNIIEHITRDLVNHRRVVNAGVDMGALEWQRACLPDVAPSSPGVSGNGIIDTDDLLGVIGAWGQCDGCVGDVDNNGSVNTDDLLAVMTGWGFCP